MFRQKYFLDFQICNETKPVKKTACVLQGKQANNGQSCWNRSALIYTPMPGTVYQKCQYGNPETSITYANKYAFMMESGVTYSSLVL